MLYLLNLCNHLLHFFIGHLSCHWNLCILLSCLTVIGHKSCLRLLTQTIHDMFQLTGGHSATWRVATCPVCFGRFGRFGRLQDPRTLVAIKNREGFLQFLKIHRCTLNDLHLFNREERPFKFKSAKKLWFQFSYITPLVSIILFRPPQRNPCREALLPWASRTWTWPLCLSALTQILMHWFLRMPRILVIWATNSGNSICPLPSFQTKLLVHMFADLHLFTLSLSLSLSPSLLLDTSDVIVFCSPKHQKAIYNS